MCCESTVRPVSVDGSEIFSISAASGAKSLSAAIASSCAGEEGAALYSERFVSDEPNASIASNTVRPSSERPGPVRLWRCV